MKVVVVSNMYAYPGNWDKLDALARHVELHVITPERWATSRELHPVDAGSRATDRGWVHHPLPTIGQGNPFRYVYRPLPLLRVLRHVRPSVVHVEQEPESLSLLELSMLKLALGYRVVFVAWENVNPLRLGWPMRTLNYALADGAIFGNSAALKRTRRLGYRGRAALIPQYGFEIATGDRGRAPRDGRFRVGYAGRLVAEKGVETLLDAVRSIADVELLVAGDGPLRDRVAGEPRVHWLGNLDRSNLASFWSSIEALAVPSLTTRAWAEQFGRVLVEAMAHGVPVIGSDSGAIPEVIGDAGLVVPEADAAALARAIERLAGDDALRRDLVARGHERVERCYRNDVVMPATVRFHEAIVGSVEPRATGAGMAR